MPDEGDHDVEGAVTQLDTARVAALQGDEAVAEAVRQCDVDVVAAYPITPQTIIVEKLAEFVADGKFGGEFVPVASYQPNRRSLTCRRTTDNSHASGCHS